MQCFHHGKGTLGMKLTKLAELVKCLQQTTSINSKIDILKGKPELLKLLDCIYDPKYKFHVRSSALKGDSSNAKEFDCIENLLSALHKRDITGKSAISSVEYFIQKNSGHAELIKMIIDKNLKARIGHELIKRASQSGSECESEVIKCALGFSLNQPQLVEYLKKSLGNSEEWFISRKLDGIRAFLKHENGKFDLLSRRKVPITSLNPNISNIFKQTIQTKDNFILDGELVVIDAETGRDDFSTTISAVKSLEPKPIKALKYYAFDILMDNIPFGERQIKLKETIATLNIDFIEMVKQEPLVQFNQEQLIQAAIDSGYEGFILRRDSLLKDGRSRDLLKLKPFEDAEFRVIGREIGPMRVLTGRIEREEQLLLSLTVDYKGFPVKIGSGFSIAERREFAAMPESKLFGSLVTVRYQSESKAKDRSENSLRFPVFKHFHGESRTE